MSNNKNLRTAKTVKNDEFYTRLVDIEKELLHYVAHFKDKIVFCNCDDPRTSSFFKYFVLKFKDLGLKKLIASCFIDGGQGVFIDYTGCEAVTGIPRKDELTYQTFKGDGDFRSDEVVVLLKQADVIVTNPPFSLFRDFIAQLDFYDKKFLVIGAIHAVGYKEVFRLIGANKLWLGVHSGKKTYKRTDKTTQSVSTYWFTNLTHNKRNKFLKLHKEYNSEDYPKYYNYNAINIDKVAEIPCDYFGAMGVPITFLRNFNPMQFEIIRVAKPFLKRRKVYNRILIKRK